MSKQAIGVIASIWFSIALQFTEGVPAWLGIAAWAVTACAGLWWLYLHFAESGHGVDTQVAWRELEERFKELRQKEIRQSHEKRIAGLVDALTFQDHEKGGEFWRLMGSNREIADEAERLLRIAGAKLKGVHWDLPARVQRTANDMDRWLYFVVEIGQHTRHLKSSGSGRPDRNDYWISGIVDESVKACLECLARESASVTP